MSVTTQNVSNCSNRTFERDLFDADGNIRIPFYAIIFLLSVMGNCLVILTLFQNRRMRTITNVFLLNLSISDLLLAVFCMPFTLIPLLLRNFIFGEFMCVAIRYLQGKWKLNWWYSDISFSSSFQKTKSVVSVVTVALFISIVVVFVDPFFKRVESGAGDG